MWWLKHKSNRNGRQVGQEKQKMNKKKKKKKRGNEIDSTHTAKQVCLWDGIRPIREN